MKSSILRNYAVKFNTCTIFGIFLCVLSQRPLQVSVCLIVAKSDQAIDEIIYVWKIKL